ncbi:uncharacterized protein [Venturia canescens]|uniref:uncharacterized protein n=1 Tax=Venturia canescens TaxID=32260 RepID=UPI001C9BDB6E|nr:uncharacterized protein LOC122405858 [Venturia canescens]
MPKKRKFASVEGKCRVCLRDDGCMSYIFSEDIKPKFDEFTDSSTIKIENVERLPQHICHVCLYKLDMWIEFKHQFLRSYDMLREHLDIDGVSETTTLLTKRKVSESQELPNNNALEKNNAKKRKIDDCVEEGVETAGKLLDRDGTIEIKDSSGKLVSSNAEAVDGKPKDYATSMTVESSPIKQTSGKRGKTTERREASTKRWVARKRALMAATGENDTETDSESSEEAQLSPVQKARAKCNAEKVAAESQRRISESLKSFASNMANNCEGEDKNDEEKNKKLLDLEAISSELADYEKKQEKQAMGLEMSTKRRANEDKIETMNSVTSSPQDTFLPHSMRSELTVDDATFVVTSTLVLTEPHKLSRIMNLPKDNRALETSEILNQERNTDIIDAVQLRRVSPKSTPQSDKKLVERCLNIEVEGTELHALKRVQANLATYVETKLIIDLESGSSWKLESKKQPCQSLDKQLQTIVEKSIKKNLSTAQSERSAIRGKNTFSPEFVRAAMRSKIFQPRVVLVRYEATEQKMSRPNVHSLVPESKLTQVPIASLGKRRNVVPTKFADYDGSHCDDALLRDSKKTEDLISSSSDQFNRHKTYGPALTKLMPISITSNKPHGNAGQTIPELGETWLKASIQVPSASEKTLSTLPIESNVLTDKLIPGRSRIEEKHICGVCRHSFATRSEVEIHLAAHKVPLTPSRQVKRMRCKRCHEIVEACNVKLHVCNSSKNKMIIKPTSPSRIANEHSENTRGASSLTSVRAKKRSLGQQFGGVVASNDVNMCFVCDKTFEDEQILKDHLQKHCDDISDEEEVEDGGEGDVRDEMGNGEEGETINEKELYQCAICGESLESEDALETHVEKHLCDDEDDNPNLISIGDREKTKNHDIIHICNQCNEPFDSEMLLMLHMQAHEEEIAIAEWERRGVDNSQVEQHICVICDQLFPTEAELSEHLDVHNGNAHVCLLCDKPFLTLEELQAHVDDTH